VTQHKYWSARLDGRSVPIEAANVAYQGVRVPAGRHVIEVEYRNTLLVRAATLSAIVLIGLIAAAAAPRKRPATVEFRQ
jgi:uncharacterized membrane protein YfhO